MIMLTGATILGIADATHYLVGETDQTGSFSKLPQLERVAVCDSLSEAKALLRSHHYDQASLKLQSAYDEMCGTGDSLGGMIEQSIKL